VCLHLQLQFTEGSSEPDEVDVTSNTTCAVNTTNTLVYGPATLQDEMGLLVRVSGKPSICLYFLTMIFNRIVGTYACMLCKM